METTTNQITKTTNLYRITNKDAQHLMMAPAVAGGFCAVGPAIRDVVEHVVIASMGDAYDGGPIADVLAHLPEDMFDAYKTRPVDAKMAERIAAHLAREVDDDGEPLSGCVDISDRIRAILSAL